MALTKCKECEGEVSTKAETCPRCGAPVKRGSGGCAPVVVLAVVIVGVLLVGYGAFEAPPQRAARTPSAQAPSVAGSAPAKASALAPEPALPRWTSHKSTDEMTGKQSSFANSPSVAAVRTMDFPYSRVTVSLHVGCDFDSEWIYFAASEKPNIADDETESGYNVIRTRLRWDEEVVETRLTQEWGERFLRVSYTDREDAISRVIASSVVRLELNWYGEGRVHFDVPLRGSSAAVAEARARCATYDAD
jgi:hypothetical protein